MKIEKKKDTVVVDLEDSRLVYSESDFDEENYLTSEGVVRLEEWKIDLVKNHGVDINEL